MPLAFRFSGNLLVTLLFFNPAERDRERQVLKIEARKGTKNFEQFLGILRAMPSTPGAVFRPL